MRICSFVPSATEMLYALGLGDSVVGVTHECDEPAEAARKPVLIRASIDHAAASSAAIDAAVHESLRSATPLYTLDTEGLRRAAPDLIITQDLCDVCAIDISLVTQALGALDRRPQVLALHPHTVDESLDQLRLIGEATGRAGEAGAMLSALRERLGRIERLLDGAPRPRVFCLEWLEPPMASGHWVPQQVALAGGEEVLGRAGAASRYVTWDEVAAARPEVLILMPCGFSIDRTRQELPRLKEQACWPKLPAVQRGQVYLVNGPAYFNRSGPRLVDGVELLARLLHPDRVPHQRAGATQAAGL